jgi:hypothetical protein
VSLKGAKHDDIFGDIPPSMDFGNLALPPDVAKTVSCKRCDFTYTSLDMALSTRALAKHNRDEHTLLPNKEEQRRLREAGWIR